jgi:hypothetical protein
MCDKPQKSPTLLPLICSECHNQETLVFAEGGPVLVFHRRRYFNGSRWETCKKVFVASPRQRSDGSYVLDVVERDATDAERALFEAASAWRNGAMK